MYYIITFRAPYGTFTFSYSFCRYLDSELYEFYDRAYWLYDAALLTMCLLLNMLFSRILTLELFILGILSTFNFPAKRLNALTNPIYLNLLSLRYLLI